MYLPEKPDTAPAGATPILLQAIVTKLCIAATYNRDRIILAPHVLFTKHEALHVGGVTIERAGLRPRELRMGVFKLDGLGDIAITDRAFETSMLWHPADERFATGALIAVEG